MKITNKHFYGVKDCPFTFNGTNLTELRRAKLRPIAKALDVPDDGSKNDIVGRLITRLRSMESNPEITEVLS